MPSFTRTRSGFSPAFLGGIAAAAADKVKLEAALSAQAAAILANSGADLAALSPEGRAALEASLVAAPPTAKEASAPAAARGDAPQAEDLSDKAARQVETVVQGPKAPEEVKPKWLTKDVATAAQEAPAAVQTLAKEIQALMSKTKANADALSKFQEGLGQHATDEALRQKTQMLYDAINKEELKCLRVSKYILSADVSNKMMSANLSKTEVAAVAAFNKVIAEHKAAQAEAAKKIAELTQKAFARSGGTQKQEERVAFFEGIARLQAEARTGEEKAMVVTILAGLSELLHQATEWFKNLFKDLPDLDAAADNLVKAFGGDGVKAAAGDSPRPGSPESSGHENMGEYGGNNIMSAECKTCGAGPLPTGKTQCPTCEAGGTAVTAKAKYTGDIDADFEATDVDIVADTVAKNKIPINTKDEAQVEVLAKYLAERARQIYKANERWGTKMARAEASSQGARDQLYMWMEHWADSWTNNGGMSTEDARKKKFGTGNAPEAKV